VEVQREKARFDAQGITIVVVSFADSQRLAGYQRLQQWPFLILADPERTAYRHFHLERLSLSRLFSLSTLKLYFKLLWKGKKIQDYGKDDYYQAGGDFLLDREGNLLFAYRSHDPADRPSVERLLAKVSNH